MPSYLGVYSNCADNREKRFLFAVNSFLKQTFKDAELCILSDGCDITKRLYEDHFSQFENIKFSMIKRNVDFSDNSRNAAIEMASGEFVTFLDTDDFVGEEHLEIINKQIDKHDIEWAYYNDYSYIGHNCFQRRTTKIVDSAGRMVIGTSSIIYKRNLPLKWGSGYGHDHVLIKEMIEKFKFVKFSKTPQYFICHIPLPGPSFNVDDPRYCYS